MSINHSNGSTIIGLDAGHIEWQAEFQANRDNMGKWKGSESFLCNASEATKYIPKQYAPCQYPGFSFMLTSGVKVENFEGNFMLITVEYGGFQEGDGSSEFDNETKYTIESSTTTEEEPIESHPKFKDVPIGEKIILQNVKSGKLIKSDESDYKFINNDDHQKAIVKEVTSELGKKLADYINGDHLVYMLPRQTLRCTYNTKTKPSIDNEVGKIVTPPKTINAVGTGLNWIFLGLTITESDGVYSVSEEYMLSVEQGWDAYLYG